MILNAVLLVEDNTDDEYLALRVLRKAGMTEISVARDGQEALDMLLDQTRPLPEIVLLDLRLPRVDGLKVLKILREEERTHSLPVLILSSSEDPRDREICRQLGVLSFLGKPLELRDFQLVMTQCDESLAAQR